MHLVNQNLYKAPIISGIMVINLFSIPSDAKATQILNSYNKMGCVLSIPVANNDLSYVLEDYNNILIEPLNTTYVPILSDYSEVQSPTGFYEYTLNPFRHQTREVEIFIVHTKKSATTTYLE